VRPLVDLGAFVREHSPDIAPAVRHADDPPPRKEIRRRTRVSIDRG
jgi:hypothetical protein